MGGFAGASLGTLSVQIEAEVDKAAAELRKFGDDTARMLDDQKSKWASLADVAPSLMGLGAVLSGVTVAMGAIGAAGVSAAEGLNTARVGFTTMLGSAEAAEKMLKDLQAFAATTPFEFTDLVRSAQRMKALGFEADQVIPTLRAIGDAAAAMGGGKEHIDGLTTALGQMIQKGKVSAEEMNQLSERGVSGWKYLAEAAGVSIAEVQKLSEKGALNASQAVQVILDGMRRDFGGNMEKMSQTLTGQWSNLKDQLTQALIPIGQALIPALQALLPVLSAVVAKAVEAANFFNEMPEPLKNAALAVAALAAAAGPLLLAIGGITNAIGTLMPALTSLAGFFGVSIAALGGWALAIAGIVAALAALGTWIYQNWDAIVAVLTQAWDGLTDAWSSVWSRIKGVLESAWAAIEKVFGTIFKPLLTLAKLYWDAVITVWSWAWEKIAGNLSNIWNDIRNTAAKVWGWITNALDKFIETARKIPGVNKLFNLDEAWKSAQKLGTETEKTTTKITEAKPAVVGLITETGRLTEKHKEAAAATTKFHDAIILEKLRMYQAETNKLVHEIAAYEIAVQTGKYSTDAWIATMDQATAKITAQGIAIKAIPLPQLTADLDAAIQRTKDYDTSLDTMGNTGNAAYGKLTKGATDAGNAVTGMKQPFEEFATSVSTVITNFAQDISKSLWDGDMSWGEKGKSLLKSLGQAVTSSFIEPATKALNDFIKGAIADLLGGKGFGGIMDSIKGIGGAFGGIFGGGGDKPGVPGVPSIPGTGGGGAAGGIGGALGGALGWVNAIGGIASGIMGFFQGRQQEKTLNAIEESTRYLKIGLVTQGDSLLSDSHIMRNIATNMEANYWGTTIPAWTSILTAIETAIDWLKWIEYPARMINGSIQAIEIDTRAMAANVERVVSGERILTMNLSGSDPDVVAARIAQQLRMQGAAG